MRVGLLLEFLVKVRRLGLTSLILFTLEPILCDMLCLELGLRLIGLPILLLERSDLREIFILMLEATLLVLCVSGLEELLSEQRLRKAKPRSSFEGSSSTIEALDFLPPFLLFVLREPLEKLREARREERWIGDRSLPGREI